MLTKLTCTIVLDKVEAKRVTVFANDKVIFSDYNVPIINVRILKWANRKNAVEPVIINAYQDYFKYYLRILPPPQYIEKEIFIGYSHEIQAALKDRPKSLRGTVVDFDDGTNWGCVTFRKYPQRGLHA